MKIDSFSKEDTIKPARWKKISDESNKFSARTG